jgi:hypothetical protein
MSSFETSAAKSTSPTDLQLDHTGLTPVPNPEVPVSHAQASSADSNCCQGTYPTNNFHHAVGSFQTQYEPKAYWNGCVAANGSRNSEVGAAVAPCYGLGCGDDILRTTQDASQRLEISHRFQLSEKERLSLKRRIREEDAASREIRACKENTKRLVDRINALMCDVKAARRETWVARQRLKAVQMEAKEIQTRTC